MVQAICTELELRKNYLPADEPIQSIYFGGGTPSLLREDEISQIMNTLQSNYDLDNVMEVTLEANPDDINEAGLTLWKSAEINRLSIGVQSFDDALLKDLNRAHTAKTAVEAIKAAHRYDFKNLNLDLIYGIPGQSMESLEETIDQLLDLNPMHISAYCLTIEENTVFGKWSKTGKIIEKDEETIAEHYDLVTHKLFDYGFEQYEVSNFSLPGKHSIHNSSYWKQDSYLGIGPSAHSYDKESRHINVANNANYMKSISQGVFPAQANRLNETEKIEEYVLTSIRTKWGMNLEFLEKQYDVTFKNTFQGFLNDSLEAGYIIIDNRHISLTPKGKLIADEVTVRFFDHFLLKRHT